MTENEKLRSLLAGARRVLGPPCEKESCGEVCAVVRRIDAALAEPVAANPVAVAEMAALYHVGLSERILPSEAVPWVIEAVKLVERERDEARAEGAVLEKQNIELNDASVALEKQLAEARAEVERLRGLTPEFPPRPPDGEGLPRYGLRWNGPVEPIAVPMDDGYWTPWHLADASYKRGAEAMREAAIRVCEEPQMGTEAEAIRALPIPEDKP